MVAVGECAADGGVFADSYAIIGGVGSVVPVDIHMPGCPPRRRGALQQREQSLQQLQRRRRAAADVEIDRNDGADPPATA